MAVREIAVMVEASLITCVVQRGMADRIVEAATRAGAQGATIYYARGTGVRERLGVIGLALSVEKEVVNIVVANDQIDRVLERVYLAGTLDTPGMGIAHVTPLEKIATYVPKEIAQKLATREVLP